MKVKQKVQFTAKPRQARNWLQAAYGRKLLVLLLAALIMTANFLPLAVRAFRASQYMTLQWFSTLPSDDCWSVRPVTAAIRAASSSEMYSRSPSTSSAASK